MVTRRRLTSGLCVHDGRGAHLIKAKCQGKGGRTLASYMPEAVSQAIALSELKRLVEIILSKPITQTLETVAMKCIFVFRMVRDGFSVSSKGMMGEMVMLRVSLSSTQRKVSDIRQAIARDHPLDYPVIV